MSDNDVGRSDDGGAVGQTPAERAQLFELLARELRRIAGSLAGSNDTVHPTVLVNEAYLKLQGSSSAAWNDHAHFLRVAAKTMRSILIDHKRRKSARKHGGKVRHEPLDDAVHGIEQACGYDLEAIHEALNALAREDQMLADYVDLRFFGGRTNGESAAALGISERSGTRTWELAKRWLHRRLAP